MTSSLAILYSFRRCPYAIRARLAILFAELQVELREVVLKDKPAQMLAISPKGTVPVLQLSDEAVIEESIEIMIWALKQRDPQGLLSSDCSYDYGYNYKQQSAALIEKNDKEFKYWLDRYKYADRNPEMSQTEYRRQGEVFLKDLETLLTKHRYLLSDQPSLTDIAIMPFVRQFAHVDREVFDNLPYPRLQRWLKRWLEHPIFIQAMAKVAPWQEGDEALIFPF